MPSERGAQRGPSLPTARLACLADKANRRDFPAAVARPQCARRVLDARSPGARQELVSFHRHAPQPFAQRAIEPLEELEKASTYRQAAGFT